MSDLTIELVGDIAVARDAESALARVWGPGQFPAALMFMIGRTGGYLSVARLNGGIVGASMGFLAHGGRELHSHVTGVVAGLADRGVGEALKRHQRSWAFDHGIGCITWTFDPLVRRNAWFNLAKLGVTVRSYEIDVYGAMNDEINGGDESDRLLVSWSTEPSPPPGPVAAQPGDVVVDVPADISALRATDPARARRWRRELRAALHEPMTSGWSVVGVTPERAYVLREQS